MTPEQYQQYKQAGYTEQQLDQNLVASGFTPQAIAAIKAPGNLLPPLPTAGASNSPLARMRTAPPPGNAGQSFSDDNGKYDGDYLVTIKRVAYETKRTANIHKIILRIDESFNDNVAVGAEREHVIFMKAEAAFSEANELFQIFSDAMGNSGPYTDAFYQDAVGERQPLAGKRMRITVMTKPQKNNPAKSFTHVRWSSADAPAPTAAPLPQVLPPMPAPAVPPSLPGGSAQPAAPALPPLPVATAAPAPALPPLPIAQPGAPQGWSPNVPWPGGVR